MKSQRFVGLAVSAIIIGFGAILLADGLADAENRAPSSGKRYMDRKEIAISGAFLLGGAIVVALSYATLRPRHSLKPTLMRAGLALGCGLILSLAMRGVDVRFDKPHWFTTNVQLYMTVGDQMQPSEKIRARALVEILNDMF